MRPLKMFVCCIAVAAVGSMAVSSQPRNPSGAVVYEGARLIIGDGSAPIENGAFVVQNGRIAAIGQQGDVKAPAGAARVDLTGKTVMPAMINVHVHIGYEGYTTWRAREPHARRTSSITCSARRSTAPPPRSRSAAARPTRRCSFSAISRPASFRRPSRFFFMPGMAPPNGGPDAVLRVATTALHVDQRSLDRRRRRAPRCRRWRRRRSRHVKIWVDDRRGTYPKMTPEVYTAIIDEAHKHQMIVHAHATTLADQKAVVRAGADVARAHGAGREAGRRVPRAAAGEEAVLGDGDRARRSDRRVQARSVLRSGAAAEGDRPHSRHHRAASAGAELRAAVAERGAARGDPRLQLSADDRVRRAHRARHRHRHSARPHVRIGRARRARALGAARADAVAGDRRGDQRGRPSCWA